MPRAIYRVDEHGFEIDEFNFENYRIFAGDVFDPPEPAYLIKGQLVGSLGNFSIISGKPKSRKSFLVSAIVASVLRGSFGELTSPLNGMVLYADTEQGETHCAKLIERVANASGLLDIDVNERLYFLTLREANTTERLRLIEEAIESLSGMGLEFVVIDGIRDLVYDINNPEESTKIIDKLMEWTAKHDLHILCVLHENKINSSLRGHLGTEGANKAETVIHVELVDSHFSKVEPSYTRNKEFEPIMLQVNDEGEMSFTDCSEKKTKPLEFDMGKIKGIVDAVFKEKPSYNSKGAFVTACQRFYYEVTQKDIGRNKALTLLEVMEDQGLIKVEQINTRTFNITQSKGSFI